MLYAFAAVSPEDGQMTFLILPWVDAKLMELSLPIPLPSFPTNTASCSWMEQGGTRPTTSSSRQI